MNDESVAPPAAISRRAALRRGVSLALGAAGGPLAVGGCRQPPKPEPVKVGLLHSQTGTMAISETSLRDIELFALAEINAAGGVLGRQVAAVVEDPRSRFDDLFPRRARKLLEVDKVVAVFGCWTSASRKAVLPVFEELGGLLFYPLQYEGNESSPNVVYGGSVPNQQILPALDWLRSPSGGSRRRIFLVGSDYIYPWTASYVMDKHLAVTFPDTAIVGRRFLPLGHRGFGEVVQAIQDSRADAVINLLNGDSNLYFFDELHGRGVDPAKLPVLSTSIGEDELRGLLPAAVKGHLAVWNYFQSLDTPRNRDFIARFQTEHGEDRVLSDPMESAYVAVYLWKAAVERAGSFDPMAVRAALAEGISLDAPGGEVRLDPKTRHMHKRCRIGRIRDDRQFDVIWEGPRLLAPEPYPQDAFPGWSCDWTRGGLVEGEPVRIRPRGTAG